MQETVREEGIQADEQASRVEAHQRPVHPDAADLDVDLAGDSTVQLLTNKSKDVV